MRRSWKSVQRAALVFFGRFKVSWICSGNLDSYLFHNLIQTFRKMFSFFRPSWSLFLNRGISKPMTPLFSFLKAGTHLRGATTRQYEAAYALVMWTQGDFRSTGGLFRNATHNKWRHWSQLISSSNVIMQVIMVMYQIFSTI